MNYIKKADEECSSCRELEEKQEHDELSNDTVTSEFCLRIYKRKALSQ